jgi:hypothetical protein
MRGVFVDANEALAVIMERLEQARRSQGADQQGP